MKKYIVIIFIALGLVCSGCKKILEPQQIDLIYNEVYWETPTDAQAGLNGVYALYRGLMVNGRNWYARADATTGFIRSGWNGGSQDALFNEGNYDDVASLYKMWGSLEDYSDWSDFYKVVSQVNLVISKVEKMDKSVFSSGEYERVLGEAYFLRALVYFNILRIWGNAPYVSESIESSDQVLTEDKSPVMRARTDDVEIGTHILEDVYKAIGYLKYDSPGTSTWGIRADKGAAEALCGHVNMWMNFLAKRDRLSGYGDYVTDAIAILEEFKANANRSYVDYSDSAAVAGIYTGGSKEAVFEIYINPETNESYRADWGGVTAYTCKMTPFDGDPTKDRSTMVDFVPYSQKSNIYPEYNIATHTGDIRANLFWGAWDSPYNEPVRDTQGATTNDRTKVTWLKKYAQFTEDTYRDQDEYVAYFAYCNIPVFRYTDIMLLLAEAYYKAGKDGEARTIVNEIRHRAGLSDYTGSTLLNEIMQQRISELYGEGHLYFDMVRNNYFPNSHLMTAAKYFQEGYYWPVSSNILSTNTLISQTPYWSGKTNW